MVDEIDYWFETGWAAFKEEMSVSSLSEGICWNCDQIR
jgi:hypothetical protein